MTGLASTEMSHLGSRPTFNRTLRHLVSTTSIVETVGKGENMAELLSDMISQAMISRDQVTPLVSVVANKYEIPYESHNLPFSIHDFDLIVDTTAKWNALNFSIIYHQPNVGSVPINPSNPDHWNIVHDLKENELIVMYCQHRKVNKELSLAGLGALSKLLLTNEVVENPDFILAQAVAPPKPVKKVSTAGKNLTPKYSVQVTNELFHNGNVEAWKNIIESYEEANPECDVIVYHEGELIQDLNSLFKWGKVKHGGLLFLQISGTNIKGVSRLQKYLHEGASSRYEAFIKHDVNKVLKLF